MVADNMKSSPLIETIGEIPKSFFRKTFTATTIKSKFVGFQN